jgi:hypothetical protein
MHDLVLRIKKAELCYVFARNAVERGHEELAIEAYRRAVDLRAEEHEVESEAELMALKSFYAYEEALSYQQKKRKRATGTWQLVNRHGILGALGKRLDSKYAMEVMPALKLLKMEDYTFQAVADNYPEVLQEAA